MNEYVILKTDENPKGSKMKVTLEVDSEIATKFVNDEINKLTDDERKVIIKEVLIESVNSAMKQDAPNNLLVSRDYNGVRLTSLAERLINNINIDDKLTELKNKMVDDLIKNHESLVERAILNSIVNNVAYSQALNDAIRGAVYSVLNEIENRRSH